MMISSARGRTQHALVPLLRLLSLSLFPILALLLASCAARKDVKLIVDSVVSELLPPFNRLVVDTLREYPTDGTHGYWWPKKDEPQYSGSSRDLFFRGRRVMTGEAKRRTYCCGLTLEVFLRAYQRWLETNGGEEAAALEVGDWRTFQRLWFVEKKNGPGPGVALERYGLGRSVQPEDVLPGDFVQIWRTRDDKGKETGHSVIFLAWVRAKNPGDKDKKKPGEAVGLLYWSTQPGTKGISERVEFFGPFGGVSTEHTHYARVELDAK